MGEFPIYTTQRSLPGMSGGVTANLNPRTGGELVGEAVMGFGRAVTDFGVDMYVAQGRAELAEAFAADKEEINQLMIDLESESDPEVYRQKFEEVWSGIESREVKNGFARKRRAEALPGFRVNVGEIVHEKAKLRVDENMDAALDNAAADAIQTGRMTNYRTMLEAEGKRRGWSKEVQHKMLGEVVHDVELEAFRKQAMADPEGMMLDLEDNKVEGARHLTTNDLMRLRDTAMGRLNDDIIIKNRMQGQYLQGLWKVQTDPNSTSDQVIAFIDKLPEQYFSDEEKFRLVRQAKERSDLIAGGWGDPLLVRKDNKAYWDLLQRAQDKSVTLPEIRAAVGNKITIADEEHLKKVLEDEPQARVDAYSMTSVMKTVDALIEAGLPDEKDMAETAKLKAKIAIEDAVKASQGTGKPLTGRDLLAEAITIQRRVLAEAQIRGGLEELLPVGEINQREPANLGEFLERVARLKATDMEAAKSYYDRYAGKFRGQ